MTHVQSPPTIEPPSSVELMGPDSTSLPQQFPDIPPVFAQPSSDEALDTPSLDAWTNQLNAQQRRLDDEKVIVRAPSVQDAARGIWSAILALANNRDQPEPEAGCVINNFTAEAIMSGSPQVHVYG